MVQFACKFGNELRAAVGDDGGGEAVVLPDFAKEQGCCSFGGDVGGRRDEVCPFPEGVDDVHYRIIAVGVREFHYEADANGVPAIGQSGGGVKFTEGFVALNFCPEAEVAGFCVESDVAGHLGPPVASQDEFEGLPSTGVTSDVGVVMLFHDPASEIGVVWYVDLSPVKEKAVVLYPFCTADLSSRLVLFQPFSCCRD